MSKSPRITTYASLATAATTVAVGGSADAAIVVGSIGTTIKWNPSGTGEAPSVTVTGFGGLAGFKIATQAAANGHPAGDTYIGAKISWQGAGSGRFRRGYASVSAAFLANYGSNQTAGNASNAFAYVNRGTWYSTSIFSIGNPAFANPDTSNPSNSKYLLFNFSDGFSTYYGWIEVLSMTVSPDNTRTNINSVTLGRWAYEDTGFAITAGQISLSPVPGGAGLAALAFGAAGVRSRRRSRN